MPGLTGLWQVSGKNHTTFDEMVRLDIRYAEKISWPTDIGIIFRTIPALCAQIIETRESRQLMKQTAVETGNVGDVEVNAGKASGRPAPLGAKAFRSVVEPADWRQP